MQASLLEGPHMRPIRTGSWVGGGGGRRGIGGVERGKG